MKMYMGEEQINLNTRWRRLIGFTPRMLYSWRKSPQYPLDRRLDSNQGQSGCCG
jgi:hypothetical protein